MSGRRRLAAALVILAWVLAAGLAAPFAARLNGIQQNDQAAFLPTSAESTRVGELQPRFQSARTIPVIVVYERASGITDADRGRVAEQAAAVAAGRGIVGGVSSIIPSADGKAVEFVAGLNSQDVLKLGDEVAAIRAQVRGGDGLSAYVTGPAALAADFGSAFKGLDVKLLAGTGLVVVVILLAVYRSPFLWVVPIGVVGFALAVAQALVYLAATRFGLQSNGQSQGILTILVFGAGTDYALLLISRYREELRRQASSVRAVLTAWRGTAPAILASGTTVVLALLVLLLSEQGANRILGASSAIGVAVVMIAMLTLMPAVLGLLGRRLFWPLVPRMGRVENGEGGQGVWDRIAARVGRRPRATWLGATALLLLMTGGLSQLHAAGLPADRQYTVPLASVTGQQVADAHFPAGTGSPLYVVAPASSQDRVADRLLALEGVSGVSAISTSPAPGAGLKLVDGKVMLKVDTTLKPDSAAAEELVVHARSAVHAVSADALVGGSAATNLDQRLASERDDRVIIPLVLLVILAVLLMLLRGVLASVLLIATVVLSFAATLAASAVFFSTVFHFAGEDASWPLTTFVFLVALGIDYNIFLMTRVREETRRLGTRAGILAGLARTGGVITSAGVVLAATFAVFTALPLVVLVEVGFSIAFGVLLDAILVRTLLVPGLMHDFGDHIWWPSRVGSAPNRRGVVTPEADVILATGINRADAVDSLLP